MSLCHFEGISLLSSWDATNKIAVQTPNEVLDVEDVPPNSSRRASFPSIEYPAGERFTLQMLGEPEDRDLLLGIYPTTWMLPLNEIPVCPNPLPSYSTTTMVQWPLGCGVNMHHISSPTLLEKTFLVLQELWTTSQVLWTTSQVLWTTSQVLDQLPDTNAGM